MFFIYKILSKIFSLLFGITAYCNKLIYFFKSLHEGFFLGALSRKQLEKLDLSYYSKKKIYHQDEFNVKPLFEWEQLAIKQYFKECKSIMVIAAGAGREVFNLSRMGFEISAYEYNEKLRTSGNSILKKNNIEVMIQASERDKCPRGNVLYAGVIVGYGSYLHIKGSANRIAFLKHVSENLSLGGVVLLSFYTRHMARKNLNRIYKMAGMAAKIFGNGPIEKGDSLDFAYVHYFSKEEILHEITKAGFKILHYDEGIFGNAVIVK